MSVGGEEVLAEEDKLPEEFSNVLVFASSPTRPPQDGYIRRLNIEFKTQGPTNSAGIIGVICLLIVGIISGSSFIFWKRRQGLFLKTKPKEDSVSNSQNTNATDERDYWDV